MTEQKAKLPLDRTQLYKHSWKALFKSFKNRMIDLVGYSKHKLEAFKKHIIAT